LNKIRADNKSGAVEYFVGNHGKYHTNKGAQKAAGSSLEIMIVQKGY